MRLLRSLKLNTTDYCKGMSLNGIYYHYRYPSGRVFVLMAAILTSCSIYNDCVYLTQGNRLIR